MEIQKVYLKGIEKAHGYNNPNKIIIHHPEYYGSVVGLNNVMRNMDYYMIGYNYYVRKDGSVWEGRPTWATGANCYGQNNQSIGVCFEGNYDKDTSMPTAQFNAGVELIQYLKKKFGISEVNGHKAYYNTACPGKNFPLSQMLKAIKDPNFNGGGSTSGSVDFVLENATTRNVNSSLNIREKGTSSSKVVGSIPAGDKFRIKWVDKDYIGWYYIEYKGITGYVSADYVAKLQMAVTQNVSSSLNVRERGTTDSKVVDSIKPDEEFRIDWVDSDYIGWYRITTERGTTGFVKADYVKKL